MSLAVLVPVLGRPHRVAPTIDGFTQTCDGTVYFIPNQDDTEEIAAIEEAGGHILFLSSGGYAEKINQAIKLTEEPLLFLGADDLEPREGWLDAAVRCIESGAQVVGVNDLIQRGRHHATHFLISRDYDMALCDGEPGPLCELYDHSCTDDELIATATHRRVYSYADNSIVKHLHPDMNWAPIDSTYEKGREHLRDDRKIWRSRRFWYIED